MQMLQRSRMHKLAGRKPSRGCCSPAPAHRLSRQRCVTAKAFKAEPATTAGYALSKEESSSLAKLAPSGAQAVSLSTLRDILHSGASKQHKDLEELEGAILAAEQVHLGSLLASGAAAPPRQQPAKGTGMWQPVFASSGGFPRLLYIPVPEYFDMTRSEGKEQAIDIITELGPLTTHFLGSCSWQGDSAFAYSIQQIRLELGGWSGTVPMPVKLDNVLSFFYVEDGVAAARSKLGGTMLLVADPEGSRKYLKGA